MNNYAWAHLQMLFNQFSCLGFDADLGSLSSNVALGLHIYLSRLADS